MAFHFFEGKAHAAAYLKYRVAPHKLVSRITDFMKEKLRFQTTKLFDLAVDVGCGSGQGTVLLAPYFKKVIGVDISLAQLEMAQVNTKPPNVTYRQATAEQLPFASGTGDLVTAMTAAHWFNRPKFLLEADRVLRRGGCLFLLSYDLDMELEFGDVSDQLNDICKEYYAALLPFRPPCLGLGLKKVYFDMFDSCTYPNKEWNGCFPVRTTIPLSGFLGLMETMSFFQRLHNKDPAEAEGLSNYFRNKFLSAMKVSSSDTDVTMVVNYFYWLACKP